MTFDLSSDAFALFEHPADQDRFEDLGASCDATHRRRPAQAPQNVRNDRPDRRRRKGANTVRRIDPPRTRVPEDVSVDDDFDSISIDDLYGELRRMGWAVDIAQIG